VVWLPRLRRILDQQAGLYQQLDTLSRQQSDHVRSGETDRLIGVLGRRQALIEQITALNAELEPFTSNWDRLAPSLEAEQRDALRERIDTLDQLMDDIAGRDEADREALERRRNQLDDEIGSLAAKKSAVSAYAGSPSSASVAPRFQNRTG